MSLFFLRQNPDFERCLRSQDLENGGDKRDRTADLLHAMQALSQLSYTPTSGIVFSVPNRWDAIWWS